MQILKKSLKNNPKLHFIADFFRPFTRRAYLVGGSVRDVLLGFELRDFDIEVYDLSPKDFDLLMQKLGAKGFGKSFFVYKFENYDLALARIENKIAKGHRGFEVVPCDDERLGAKRRDFTCNAMMINIFDFSFLDFYGGFEDLQNKTLRHIDTHSFQEDSLRVLRAVSFVSRFGFSIAEESKELMRRMDISDLSLDRVNIELYKCFGGQHLDLAYEAMQALDLEQRLFGHSFRDENFIFLLKNAQKFICDEALFLYLYLNYFKIDSRSFFKKMKIKSTLRSRVNQPFFKDEPSDLELLMISLKMPLNSWLGCYSDARISRAKALKIYDKKFHSKIKAKDLMEQGFFGKTLGEELKRAWHSEFKLYLKNNQANQS